MLQAAKRARLPQTVRSLLPFLAAAPSLLTLLVSFIFLLVWADWRLQYPDNDLNPAEAALTGDVGRLYRLLEAGSSPTTGYSIRSSLRSRNTNSMLTPLQAAVIGDAEATVVLLLGDDISNESWRAVGCMARQAHSRKIEEWLEKQGSPVGTDASCP